MSFLDAGVVPALLNAHLERGLLDNLLATYKSLKGQMRMSRKYKEAEG